MDGCCSFSSTRPYLKHEAGHKEDAMQISIKIFLYKLSENGRQKTKILYQEFDGQTTVLLRDAITITAPPAEIETFSFPTWRPSGELDKYSFTQRSQVTIGGSEELKAQSSFFLS